MWKEIKKCRINKNHKKDDHNAMRVEIKDIQKVYKIKRRKETSSLYIKPVI